MSTLGTVLMGESDRVARLVFSRGTAEQVADG
jgi:hypothetical protein